MRGDRETVMDTDRYVGKITWNKRVERSLNTGADKTGSIIQRSFHIKQNNPVFLFKMSISKKH